MLDAAGADGGWASADLLLRIPGFVFWMVHKLAILPRTEKGCTTP
jgi:hypothetical protein